MRIFIGVILAAFVFVATGCSQPEPAADLSSKPVNTICPIMGGKVQPDSETAVWNGKTVAFCCEECAPKWDQLSNEDKAAKLAAADKPDQGDDHSGHDHAEHQHES